MKQFMYLFRGGDEKFNSFSPEEMQGHMDRWGVWMGKLAEQELLVGGEKLEDEGKIMNADFLVTEGPFAEGKEVVGGYVILKAKDMEEALELAKGCPIFETEGITEIREISAM